MTGFVDSSGHAILTIRLKHPGTGTEPSVDAWIDTGITGELVLPMQMIAPMGLPLGPAVPATLADGSVVQRDAYSSSVDRFGKWTNIEVVANQGTFPLLGVGLLLGHHLDIDYSGRTLSLT